MCREAAEAPGGTKDGEQKLRLSIFIVLCSHGFQPEFLEHSHSITLLCGAQALSPEIDDNVKGIDAARVR